MLTTTRYKAEGSAQGSNSENDRDQLRKEAETLVQATEEARRDLLVRTEVSLQEEQGRQADFDTEPPNTGAAHETTEEQSPRESTVPRKQQLQKWDNSGEDTARWLYRLVFQESQLLDSRTSASSAVVLVDPAAKRRVLDGLLHAWTTLTDDEIKHNDNCTAEDPKPEAPQRGRPASKSHGVTHLCRRSVSAEALRLGQEEFKDYINTGTIIVLRELRQEEIDAYEEATATLRSRGRDRRQEDIDTYKEVAAALRGHDRYGTQDEYDAYTTTLRSRDGYRSQEEIDAFEEVIGTGRDRNRRASDVYEEANATLRGRDPYERREEIDDYYYKGRSEEATATLRGRDRFETRKGDDDYYYKGRSEEATATLRGRDPYERREEIDDYYYKGRSEEATATLRGRDRYERREEIDDYYYKRRPEEAS
jgi:hypothetical protein